MSDLREIPVSEICTQDIGRRVVLIDESGNAYDGVLVNLLARAWEYGKRPEEMVRVDLKATSARSELSLTNLPLDYRVQIDRGGS